MTPIPLTKVADELELLVEGMVAYIHRTSGEIITLSEEMRSCAEGDDEDFDAHSYGWGEDLPLEKIREVMDSDEWVALPDRFEIHEWNIMLDFTDTVQNADRRGELVAALRGRGAFRRFKDTLARHGLQDRWYAFHRQALEEIAREALDAAGIAYT
jgi:hypothetical protein